MNKRPHSREKRVSDISSSVNKYGFGSTDNNRSNYGGTSFGRVGPIRISRSSFLSGGLIKFIIIVFVLFFLFNFVKGLFFNGDSYVEETIDNSSEIVDYTYSDADDIKNNNYVLNHNVTHNSNTSSNQIDTTVSNGTRKKFTSILGDKKDEVTVMVYMIGTDLESQYGAATNDLNEMLHASLKDNINIVVETGGCSRWNNRTISNRYLERYTINSQGLSRLQSNIKSEPMTNPDVLTSFIEYSASNFPANRYILILWDHGGGSVAGYGYDEKFPNYGEMSLDNIGLALKNSKIKFDFVGFDACLMANLETALAIEPYADYLIGSEETEPGTGWYYTNWLTALDSNTSINTVELSKIIIDDYIEDSLNSYASNECTQSITDLGQLAHDIKEPLSTFSKSISKKMEDGEFQSVAVARANTKEFSRSSRLDQVDLVSLAQNFDVEGSDELIAAIKSSVKYNRSANISDSYGLSAYFPYSSLSMMNKMTDIYQKINIDNDYQNAIKNFASYAASGQIVTQNYGGSSTSIFDILTGNNYTNDSVFTSDDIFGLLTGSYDDHYGYDSYGDIFGSGYDLWFGRSNLKSVSNNLTKGNLVDTKQLNIINNNGKRVVSLEDEQWNLINDVQLNAYVDDGSGYIELGKDNVFEWDNDGNLIVDSDGTWLAIGEHVVPYYMVSDEYIDDNNYKTTGKIPAYLNGQRVDIMVSFTPSNPYGKIEGAKLIYDNTNAQQKGLIDIVDGDKINFICKYFSYDGEYLDEYQLGDTYVVDGAMELYNNKITNRYMYTYCFRDIYGNSLWTPVSIID